jgi:hypothetical protein
MCSFRAERLNHQFVLGKQSAFCRVCADFRRFAPETVAGLLFNASAVPPCNAGAAKPQNHNFVPHSSGNLCTYCGYNMFNSATLERLLQLYRGRLGPISVEVSDWLTGQGVDIDRKDAQVPLSEGLCLCCLMYPALRHLEYISRAPT